MTPSALTLLGQLPPAPIPQGQYSGWMVWVLLFAAAVLVLLVLSRKQDPRGRR